MSALAKQFVWPAIRQYLKIEKYSPDGGHRRPRIRIEWTSMPLALAVMVIKETMPCVACGRDINFVRQRTPAKRGDHVGHLYYAPCCPLTVSIGCSRGNAARDEYNSVRAENA